MKLLVAEDSRVIRESLTDGLRKEGHVVDAAADGTRALAMGMTMEYDAIILDWMLPGLDGLGVLGALRERGKNTVVLIVTAKERVGDRVRELRSVAVDNIIEPFSFDELLARLEALGGRDTAEGGDRLPIGDFV